MISQENEGLLSPLIRDIRLRKVASYIKPKSVVLDLACGSGHLAQFLPDGCRYYGVDREPGPKTDSSTDFLTLDLLEHDSFDRIQKWLRHKPDYITCIAFLEHVGNPEQFLRTYHTLLGMNGRIIITTPHPRGRLVHTTLAYISLCSWHAAKQHEHLLHKKDIEHIAQSTKGSVTMYKHFLFGLNQIFVIEYPLTKL
ncbi:class I SAM-dependent methyltransferase [bacterium]|nr:class I SAM-dependent methyltransferase [bacterium]